MTFSDHSTLHCNENEWLMRYVSAPHQLVLETECPAIEIVDDKTQKCLGFTFKRSKSGHFDCKVALHRAVWTYSVPSIAERLTTESSGQAMSKEFAKSAAIRLRLTRIVTVKRVHRNAPKNFVLKRELCVKTSRPMNKLDVAGCLR